MSTFAPKKKARGKPRAVCCDFRSPCLRGLAHRLDRFLARLGTMPLPMARGAKRDSVVDITDKVRRDGHRDDVVRVQLALDGSAILADHLVTRHYLLRPRARIGGEFPLRLFEHPLAVDPVGPMLRCDLSPITQSASHLARHGSDFEDIVIKKYKKRGGIGKRTSPRPLK